MSEHNKLIWPDSVRLKMIERGKFYEEPRIYEYGYFDGYQYRSEQISKAIKKIQEVRQGYLNPDSLLQDAILELLK